jgi:hypothetical protein
MCRSIKTLFNFDPPATDDEIRAAALQFVRKLSGFNTPSKVNEAAFGDARQSRFVHSRISWRLIRLDQFRNIASPVKKANYHNSVRLGAIINRVSLMEGYT